MKELQPHELLKKSKPQQELQQERQQEYKLVYQGTIIPYENHTLFEINLKTLEISEAEYENQDYILDWAWYVGKKIKVDSKVIMKEGFAYVSALNKNNALKKFKKNSSGTRIDTTKTYIDL